MEAAKTFAPPIAVLHGLESIQARSGESLVREAEHVEACKSPNRYGTTFC
jgi:hypothetical protein